MPLAPLFGRDVGISSKVPSIQPSPPAKRLGSHVTSNSGSCLPFLPSLCFASHGFKQNDFVRGVMVELTLALWHSAGGAAKSTGSENTNP